MNEWQKRMGVGQRQPRPIHDPNATHTTKVVADEGTHRGTPVGTTTEHMSGRVDAKVTKAEIHWNPNIHATRRPAT